MYPLAEAESWSRPLDRFRSFFCCPCGGALPYPSHQILSRARDLRLWDEGASAMQVMQVHCDRIVIDNRQGAPNKHNSRVLVMLVGIHQQVLWYALLGSWIFLEAHKVYRCKISPENTSVIIIYIFPMEGMISRNLLIGLCVLSLINGAKYKTCVRIIEINW